jgi:hypothetical protein
VGQFNPSSLAEAPDGLCGRCKYVVAIRVDPLHQCDSSSFYQSLEAEPIDWRGTAIAILDEHLRLVSWTWLLLRPSEQLADAPDRYRSQVICPPSAHHLPAISPRACI